MDAANMLKPALARGEIQCIGATTLDEYRQNIEKDGALERRFQKVMVEPTTTDETLQILKNIKERYEEHHNVNYTDDALEACVKLTDRYITDRNFPDKAIDALDEAGSRVHLTNITAPKEIEEQEKLIDEARNNKNEAVRCQNFELAASFRDREKALHGAAGSDEAGMGRETEGKPRNRRRGKGGRRGVDDVGRTRAADGRGRRHQAERDEKRAAVEGHRTGQGCGYARQGDPAEAAWD